MSWQKCKFVNCSMRLCWVQFCLRLPATRTPWLWTWYPLISSASLIDTIRHSQKTWFLRQDPHLTHLFIYLMLALNLSGYNFKSHFKALAHYTLVWRPQTLPRPASGASRRLQKLQLSSMHTINFLTIANDFSNSFRYGQRFPQWCFKKIVLRIFVV